MVDYSKWDRMDYNDDDDDDEISIDEIVNNAISGGGQRHQRSVLDADLARIRALMGEAEVVTAIPPDEDDNNNYEDDDDNNNVDDHDGNEASIAAMHLVQLQQSNQEGNATNQRYDDNNGIGTDNHPNTLTTAKNGGDNNNMSSVDSDNDEDNTKWLRVNNTASNNTTHHRHTTRIGMEYQVTNLPTRYTDETERMVMHETCQQYNAAAHIRHLSNRGVEALYNSDNMNVDDDIDYGRNDDDNGVSNHLWMRTATTSSRSSKRQRHTRIGLEYQVAELPPSNNNNYNNNNNVAVDNNNNINYYNVPPPPPAAAGAAGAAADVAPLPPDLLPHRSVSPGGSSPEGEQF